MVLAIIPSIRNILQAEKPAYGNGMPRNSEYSAAGAYNGTGLKIRR